MRSCNHALGEKMAGRFGWAVREWFKYKNKLGDRMIKQLSNSVIAKYCDLSMSRRSIICVSLRLRQIIDLLATDKSQYFAQPRPIIVNYLMFVCRIISPEEELLAEKMFAAISFEGSSGFFFFLRIVEKTAKLQNVSNPQKFSTTTGLYMRRSHSLNDALGAIPFPPKVFFPWVCRLFKAYFPFAFKTFYNVTTINRFT